MMSVMMSINESVVRVIILDISGLYAQIHNQGYFEKESISDIKQQYSDPKHWQVLVLDD